MDCGVQKGLQKTQSGGLPQWDKESACQKPAGGWSPKGAVSVLMGHDDSRPSNKFSKGLWPHISIPDCPGWQYRTWLTDQVVSTSFGLICSFSWGHLSIQQRLFVPWLGLQSSWVGLSAEARCCKSQFAPAFTLIWPGSWSPERWNSIQAGDTISGQPRWSLQPWPDRNHLSLSKL